jgi:small GTP-binding protein
MNYFLFSVADDKYNIRSLLSSSKIYEDYVKTFFNAETSVKQETTDADNNSGFTSTATKQQFQFRPHKKTTTLYQGGDLNYAQKVFDECFSFCKQFITEWAELLLESVNTQSLKNIVDSNVDQYSVLIATEYKGNETFKDDHCRAHRDAGAITICIAPEEGLELYDNVRDEWIRVAGHDVVLFFGESMAAITNNAVSSVLHKVTNITTSRFSLVFKLRLDPKIVGPRNEADYKLITQDQENTIQLRQNKDLNQDVLEIIFLFLTPNVLCKCELVSKYWRQISSSNFVWRAQCMVQFGSVGTNVISWKQVYKQKTETKPKEKMLVSYETPKPMSTASATRFNSVKNVIVGDGGVGKTCLLLVFANNVFPDQYIPTVFDEYSTSVKIEDRIVEYSLWDTAGQEDYDRLRPLSYPNTSVFIIMFAVSSRDSFNNVLTKWKPELHQHQPNVPIVLCGSKIDMREKIDCVTYDEGVKMAQEIGAVAYFEISSMMNGGVQNVMMMAAKIGVYNNLGMKRFPFIEKETRKRKKCALQ